MSATVRITAAALGICATMAAQTLVDPAQIAATRERFAQAGGAVHLRCEFTPQRPAIGYDLEYHTGYEIAFPLSQEAGAGHEMTVLLQVTPDGREPVYLGKTEGLPPVPNTKADGELTGGFLVGEGNYTVDALVHDDTGRVCTNRWRVQAKAVGGERELKPTAPAGSVQENPPREAAAPPVEGPRIERLTILLHAAPSRARAAKMEPATVKMFTHSLASILHQLPAWSVRLAVFNQSQQAVLYQKDGFTAADLPRVTEAMEKTELARVDVKTLENRNKLDVLSDLMDKETRRAKPATAVILMGPRSAAHADSSFQPDAQAMAAARWFYLAYQTMNPVWRQMAGRGTLSQLDSDTDIMANGGPMGRRTGGRGAMAGTLAASAPPDPMEQFYRRIKGETLAVWAPHDFAEALRRIGAELPTIKQPEAPAVTPAVSEAPTLPAAAPKPAVQEIAEPAAADEGGGGQENPVEVLMRLRDEVMEHARQIPNHTCVETIERQRFEPSVGRLHKSCDALLESRAHVAPSLQLTSTDWLRLDVGLANGGEVFSWAGAARFEERDLDEIVPEGAIGTGLFAALLISVFENRNPHFRIDGEETVDGRRLFTYSFSVPQAESHYRVKTRQKTWVVTGYGGELQVDPKTAGLVRLKVHTEALPESTSSCEIDTALEYGMVPLDGFDYLLPKSTRQRFIGREGEEAENRMSFAACREYRGESTVTFGGRRDPGGEADVKGAAASLAAGQAAAIELARAVPFEGSAAGDRIEGRLAAPLGDARSGVTVAPAGARVEGRLMRVEMDAPGTYSMALRWETVEIDGVKTPLFLKPNRPGPAVKRAPAGTLQRRGMEIELPRPGEELFVVFHLAGKSSSLERGMRTEWVTTEP